MTNDEKLYPSELARAARALVDKIAVIEQSGAWNGLWFSYANHGGKWPQELNWKEELDALRALLAKEPA